MKIFLLFPERLLLLGACRGQIGVLQGRNTATIDGDKIEGDRSWSIAHATLPNVTAILAKKKSVIVGVLTNSTAKSWR